ncbi:MAG TPA: hypothetical protein VKU62_05035, partial [Thermoanaerobaculia bacterium]|nr:hypothetical protein [Thermoanaerobaculia bacterium]
MTGSLSGFQDTFTIALIKQGTQTGGSGSCNLGISLSCNGGNCTAVTTNNGSNACSGEYITGIIIEDSQGRGTVTNFHSSPSLGECFDNGSLPSIGEGIGVCVGTSFSLAAGATLTTNATVNLAGASSSQILAATIVDDPVSGDTLAETYTFNGGGTPAPSCTPIASIASSTQSANSYDVTWTAVTDPNATYTVEESTSADFSALTDTRVVTDTGQPNARSATFSHSVTTATKYYYRVRANSCSGAPGPNSAVVNIVVQPVPTITGKQGDVTVPLGSKTAPVMNVFIPGLSVPATFTATVDHPLNFVVMPSTGPLPTSGVTLTVTPILAGLPVGATTTTLTVQITASGKGGPVANDATTVTKSVSVSLVTPVAPGSKTLPPPNTLIIPAVAHAPG